MEVDMDLKPGLNVIFPNLYDSGTGYDMLRRESLEDRIRELTEELRQEDAAPVAVACFPCFDYNGPGELVAVWVVKNPKKEKKGS